MSIICPNCTYDHNLNDGCYCKLCNNNVVSFDFNKLLQGISGTGGTQISEKVQKNYDEAYNIIPESFFRTPMIYLPLSINNQHCEALIDTGAETSIISKEFAKKCGLLDMVDTTNVRAFSGVGSQTSYGKIYLVNVMIGPYEIPCTFDVLETFGFDVLFGLDLMTTHRCIIDIGKNKIRISGHEVDIKKKDY